MARLIEHEGRKYTIRDEDVTHKFTATLEDGTEVKFSSLYLHDPDLHEDKFTTVASVLKWWMKNRDAICSDATSVGVFDQLQVYVTAYFKYVPSEYLFGVGQTYETVKEFMSGYLRDPSLKIRVNRPSASRYFIADQDTEEDNDTPIAVMIDSCSLAKITISPLNSASNRSISCGERWYRHWNYTHRMNKDDYNWFRSVSNESNVYFGMELEISTKLSAEEIQYIVTEVEPKQEPFFIFKQDTSISGRYNFAYELVTVPCTPRYLRKNWKIFFNKLKVLAEKKGKTIGDYVDTSRDLTNGLHIHVSKDSFSDRPHYNKFLTAWNQWEDGVVNLLNEASARPNGYKDHSYCHISHAYRDTMPKRKAPTLSKFERQRAQRSLAQRLRGIPVTDRSCVAHDGNSQTVEVRVYQGIFDLTHVMQSISFTEAMFEYCHNVGYTGFDKSFVSNFSSFVTKQRKFASLFSIIEKGTAQCA